MFKMVLYLFSVEGFKEMDRCNLDAALDIFENILEVIIFMSIMLFLFRK